MRVLKGNKRRNSEGMEAVSFVFKYSINRDPGQFPERGIFKEYLFYGGQQSCY